MGCNEKVFRVRFENQEELVQLRRRVGYATFFPFVQPEQSRFTLDLKCFDQRLAANIILQLASQERRDNLKDATYINEEGMVDPLPLGVPRSWESFERMPKTGQFQVQYMCAPEDRNFKV